MLLRWIAWLALSTFLSAYWLTYSCGDADAVLDHVIGVTDYFRATSDFRRLGGGGGSGPDCSGDSGRRLGGATIWYCYRWEKEHVEACMAIPMILLAIVFETAFHHIKHKLEHSYVFGHSMLSERELQAMRNAAVFGKPLKLSFITRMGGEFMVLGFLAFTVWFLNRTGVFEEIAKVTEADWMHLPTLGGDYLYLAESVHMILFIAMVFYFSFTFIVVERGLHTMAMFESMRGAMIDKLKKSKAGEPIPHNPNLDRFTMLRAHFMNHGLHGILKWRKDRPQQFVRVVESMGLDETDVEAITMEELRMRFQGCFSFATFLSFAVREKVEDLIEITKFTWLFIIGILVLLATLHGLQVRLKAMAVFFQCLTIIIILVFCWKTWDMRRYIVKYHNQPNAPHVQQRVVHALMESSLLWAQILMFFNSFVMSYILVDMVQDEFQVGSMHYFASGNERIVLILFMLGSAIFQVVILPLTLVEYMYLESLPPQDTHEAQELILYILQAGGAKGAAWAPYVDEKNAQMVNAANNSKKNLPSPKSIATPKSAGTAKVNGDRTSVVLLGKSVAKTGGRTSTGSSKGSKGIRRSKMDINALPVQTCVNPNVARAME